MNNHETKQTADGEPDFLLKLLTQASAIAIMLVAMATGLVALILALAVSPLTMLWWYALQRRAKAFSQDQTAESQEIVPDRHDDHVQATA